MIYQDAKLELLVLPQVTAVEPNAASTNNSSFDRC
jgi:hypothetical protein